MVQLDAETKIRFSNDILDSTNNAYIIPHIPLLYYIITARVHISDHNRRYNNVIIVLIRREHETIIYL